MQLAIYCNYMKLYIGLCNAYNIAQFAHLQISQCSLSLNSVQIKL